jgi:hypothetical protein
MLGVLRYHRVVVSSPAGWRAASLSQQIKLKACSGPVRIERPSSNARSQQGGVVNIYQLRRIASAQPVVFQRDTVGLPPSANLSRPR